MTFFQKFSMAQNDKDINTNTAKQLQKHKSIEADLDDSEAEEPLVEHDDLVLVAAVVHDVAQGEQRGHVGQDGAAPHRVALVGDQHLLLVGSDGVVQHHGVLVLVRGREVVLEGGRQAGVSLW